MKTWKKKQNLSILGLSMVKKEFTAIKVYVSLFIFTKNLIHNKTSELNKYFLKIL